MATLKLRTRALLRANTKGREGSRNNTDGRLFRKEQALSLKNNKKILSIGAKNSSHRKALLKEQRTEIIRKAAGHQRTYRKVHGKHPWGKNNTRKPLFGT